MVGWGRGVRVRVPRGAPALYLQHVGARGVESGDGEVRQKAEGELNTKTQTSTASEI